MRLTTDPEFEKITMGPRNSLAVFYGEHECRSALKLMQDPNFLALSYRFDGVVGLAERGNLGNLTREVDGKPVKVKTIGVK